MRIFRKLKLKYTVIPSVLLLVFLIQYQPRQNSTFICYHGNHISLPHQVLQKRGSFISDGPCQGSKDLVLTGNSQNNDVLSDARKLNRTLQKTRLEVIQASLAMQDEDNLISPNVRAQYKHSICVVYRGRLGNNMFQYASSFGIGRDKNMTIAVSLHDPLSKIFQLPSARKVNNKQHCLHVKIQSEKIHCAFDPTLSNFANKQDVSLTDYLQSWKYVYMYFKRHAEQLRTEFTFKDNIKLSAKRVFLSIAAKYKPRNCTFIGLHIRRGDMASFKALHVQGYKTAPKKYIYKAVAYFKSCYKDAVFLISTDDPNWVEKHYFKFQNLLKFHLIGKHSAEMDLAILSRCDHMIITTGTFGWWAGWLSGGTTVYYKHHIKENSRLRKQFSSNYSDYFYPTWIGLD